MATKDYSSRELVKELMRRGVSDSEFQEMVREEQRDLAREAKELDEGALARLTDEDLVSVGDEAEALKVLTGGDDVDFMNDYIADRF